MIIDLLVRDGLRIMRLRLDITQAVIRQNNGTPIAVAAEYGPEGAQAICHLGDEDFHRMLRNLGIDEPVICDLLELPRPSPEARLIAGPRPGV